MIAAVEQEEKVIKFNISFADGEKLFDLTVVKMLLEIEV